MRHHILLSFDTEKEVKDLVDLVAQRAYTIDGVAHGNFQAQLLGANHAIIDLSDTSEGASLEEAAPPAPTPPPEVQAAMDLVTAWFDAHR
jgi:hypothetical protein